MSPEHFIEIRMNKPKYIFVTGGVTSSLGKGIISASLAKLLQSQGYNAAIQKLDPYINVDPGTLNPYEHGECYVTDDGAETDLDLGHYERFLGLTPRIATPIHPAVMGPMSGELSQETAMLPEVDDSVLRRERQ